MKYYHCSMVTPINELGPTKMDLSNLDNYINVIELDDHYLVKTDKWIICSDCVCMMRPIQVSPIEILNPAKLKKLCDKFSFSIDLKRILDLHKVDYPVMTNFIKETQIQIENELNKYNLLAGKKVVYNGNYFVFLKAAYIENNSIIADVINSKEKHRYYPLEKLLVIV